MTRADYYDKIRRKAPGYSTDKGIVPPHFQCEKQQQEAHHHHEQQIRGRRQSKAIYCVQPCEKAVRRIARRNLESGHTAEERIGPQCFFTGFGFESSRFVAVGSTLLHVGLTQTVTLEVIGVKESERDYGHHSHRYKKAPYLWPGKICLDFIHDLV